MDKVVFINLRKLQALTNLLKTYTIMHGENSIINNIIVIQITATI